MPSELLTCVRKSPKIMTINQTEFVVLKKISFVGVSAAAIALAVLCPSPAQALSFNWTFTSTNGNFIGPISGTIDGLNDNVLNDGSNSSMTATVTSDPFNIGSTPSPISFSGGNGILVTSGVIDTTGLQLVFSSGSQQLQLENPNGTNGIFGGYYSDSSAGGSGPMSNGSSAASNDLSVPVFTAVPAPLPLLGLGAATAFSRKLKQRIAVRRRVEAIG